MIDAANCVTDIVFRLGFQSLEELETGTPWVTLTELYQWADEAAKKMAYLIGLFVVWDSSVPVEHGNGVLQLPSTHVFTLMAALEYLTLAPAGAGLWGGGVFGGAPFGPSQAVPLATVSYQLLRLTRGVDLWALDGNWPTGTGPPVRASLDAGSVGTITLYPSPVANATLVQICQEFQSIAQAATQNPTASQIQAPSILQDMLSYAMLAGARSKESELRDGPMADHYQKRFDMYVKVCQEYFGAGQ